MARAVQTLLFTDLVSSTEKARELGDVGWSGLLGEHHRVVRSALAGHGGTEVDTAGDGFFSRFDDPIGALRAAAAVQAAVGSLGLEVRAGLHTCGVQIDEQGRLSGVGVHLAARVMAKAGAGEIVVSATLRELVSGSALDFRDLGSHELKGFSDPWRLYALDLDSVSRLAGEGATSGSGTEGEASLPARAGADRPWPLPLPAGVAAHASSVAALVGREVEWEQLLGAEKAARAGERQVVVVAGEPGIGKTRLTAAAAKAVFDAGGATVLYGRCDEDVTVAYQPWRESLGYLVEEAPGGWLASYVVECGPDLARIVPSLSRRLRDLPERKAINPEIERKDIDPETERWLVFQAAAALVRKACEQSLVVVVLDDLHWADKATIDLLRHLVGVTSGLRLLVLGTYRDSDLGAGHPLADALTTMRREPGFGRVRLSGLSDAALVAMFESIAGHTLDDGSVAVTHAIGRESAGNPYFAGELLRNLAESGEVYQDEDGRWTTRGSGVALPESVRAVVAQRVGRLGRDTAAALSAASVIGQEFDLALLAVVVEREEDELYDLLQTAVAASVLREATDVEDRFAFVHALTQRSLEQELTARSRRQLHLRVAEAIEATSAGHADSRAAELASHWIAAHRPVELDKALHYARLAGLQAMAALAPQEAVRWLTTALELAEGHTTVSAAERIGIQVALGAASCQAGDPSYRQVLLSACEAAEEAGEHGLLVDAALANSRGWFSQYGSVDHDRIRHLERAIEVCAQGDSRLAALHIRLADELTFGAAFERRRALAEKAVGLARAGGDRKALAEVLTRCGLVLAAAGTAEERLGLLEEATALLDAGADPSVSCWAGLGRLAAHLELGDAAGFRRMVEVVAGAAERLHQPLLMAMAYLARGLAAVLAGDADEVERLTRRAYKARAGHDDMLAGTATLLMAVGQMRGRVQELIPFTEDGVRQYPDQVNYRAALCWMLCEVDRDDEARHVLADALPRVAPEPDDFVWLWTHSFLALSAAHLGDTEAVTLLYERLAPFGRLVPCIAWFGAAPPVAAGLGALAATLGDDGAADAHFLTATELSERMAAPWFLASTQVGWARACARRDGPGAAGDALSTSAGRYPTIERRARAILGG